MRAFAFSLSLGLLSPDLLALALVAPMSLVSTPSRAEVELPPSAPAAKLSQQVGLTEIGVEYNCPAAKGREIWGDVVPFGKVWLTGSHAATKIRFSKDVKIGGRPIPEIAYWLLAIPGDGHVDGDPQQQHRRPEFGPRLRADRRCQPPEDRAEDRLAA